MKKIIFFASFLIAVSITNGQKKELPENPCPPGECSYGVSIVFDQFNFHKPRTGCTSGFGLCIKVHVEPICKPCPLGYPTPDYNNMKTDISGEEVKAWWRIISGKLELHLPAALQNVDGYTQTDFSVFEIEDNSFIIDNPDKTIYASVKGGQYKVSRVDDDFVVLLDLIN